MAPRRSGRKYPMKGRVDDVDRLGKSPESGYLSVYKGSYVFDSGPADAENEETEENDGEVAEPAQISQDAQDGGQVINSNAGGEEDDEQDEIVDEDQQASGGSAVARKVRVSLDNTRERVRFALENSRDFLKETPQRIRNWRRLSIQDDADEAPKPADGRATPANELANRLQALTGRIREFFEDGKNVYIAALILTGLMLGLIVGLVLIPYGRSQCAPGAVEERIVNVRSAITEPIIGAWKWAGKTGRFVGERANEAANNIAGAGQEAAHRINLARQDAASRIDEVGHELADRVRNGESEVEGFFSRVGRALESFWANGPVAIYEEVKRILSGIAWPALPTLPTLPTREELDGILTGWARGVREAVSFGSGSSDGEAVPTESASSFKAILSALASPFLTIYRYLRDFFLGIAEVLARNDRFMSKDEVARRLEEFKDWSSREQLEEQVRLLIEEEKAKIVSFAQERKERSAAIREDVLNKLRERSAKAGVVLEDISESFQKAVGDLQLRQRSFFRDIKGKLTGAYSMQNYQLQAALAAIKDSSKDLLEYLEREGDALLKEANDLIDKRRKEVEGEIEDLHVGGEAAKNEVYTELVVRKRRVMDALKRVKFSAQRLLKSWQEQNAKEVAEIERGLCTVLERGRLRPAYTKKAELEGSLKKLKDLLSLDDVEESLIQTVTEEINKVNAKLISREKLSREALTKEVVERIVADKGARPDYALRSAGAYIVSASPSYAALYLRALRDRLLVLFGQHDLDYVLGFPNSPTMAITPEVTLGKCWGFVGSAGNVTIHLSRPAVIDAFTVEHAPKSAVFTMQSAPRVLRVYGFPADVPRLSDVEPADEIFYGELEYSISDDEYHMQYYEIQDGTLAFKPARAVRVEIADNHGGDYTCLYRFRVHGTDV